MSTNDPYQPHDPNQPGQPYNPGSTPGAPYGQNPYGENPYGQPGAQGDTNAYGAPMAYSASDGSQGGYAPVQPPTQRPMTLNLAFIFIAAAGVLSAISNFLLVQSELITNMIRSEWGMFEEQMRMQLEASGSSPETEEMRQLLENPEQFISLVNSTLAGSVMAGAIISVLLYLLVGFLVWRGINAFRIIATIFGVISLLGFIYVPVVALYASAADSTMLNLVFVASILSGIAGVVCAWLRPSSDYIRQRRMARRAGFR
ncbi:DUF3824 domain-containing protein [Glutamicibacter endophyticus]|uniref:DUF3824 domain-containing protein n=1 Tax=Glutamicibacter endophyticus TaxID=1522174 RepID=UPI003AF07CE6